MPLVNRLLDAFFRTLDAVDTARERLDRVLGKDHAAAASSWDADPLATNAAAGAKTSSPPPFPQHAGAWPEDKAAPARAAKGATEHDPGAHAKGAAKGTPPKASAPGKTAEPAGTPKKKPSTQKRQKGKQGQQKANAPKAQKASRKGSVDRTGADFDSPRARAVYEHVKAVKRPVVSEEAALANKKVLARVVWALHAAHDAGSAQGLTAADASALLHLAAGMDVFSTNIARTCRDESDLIEESEPDGRIKRYRLTAAGRQAALTLTTRAI